MDEIVQIEKSSIAPIELEEVRKNDPMVIMTEKGRCRASRNLIIREAAYDTMLWRLKPDSSSIIYTTSKKEAQYRIVADNKRKQDEEK